MTQESILTILKDKFGNSKFCVNEGSQDTFRSTLSEKYSVFCAVTFNYSTNKLHIVIHNYDRDQLLINSENTGVTRISKLYEGKCDTIEYFKKLLDSCFSDLDISKYS